MANLIVRSMIGNVPTSFACSDCGHIYPVPGDGTDDEKREMLEQEFSDHVAQEHK